MAKYEVEQEDEESPDTWMVFQGNAVSYDFLKELEAKLICAILNDGIGPDFDSVERNWRWMLFRRIEKLEELFDAHRLHIEETVQAAIDRTTSDLKAENKQLWSRISELQSYANE